MQNTLTPSVTDVLGRELPVLRFYGDGSFDCPHCGYPVCAADGLDLAKHNPWCFAHPHYPAEKAREVLQERERKAAEEADRLHTRRICLAAAKERQEREARERQEKITDAKARGVCVTCLVKSGYRTEVKHRKACPHAK